MKRMIAATVMLVVTASMATAQDLIVNGHFHTDINGWTLLGQGSQAWDTLDWEFNPASGSMLLTSSAGPVTVSGQCIPITPSGTYEVGGHIRFPSGQGTPGSGAIVVGWYSTATCIGQPLMTITSPPVPSTTGGWVESFSPSVTAPAGTLAVGVGPAILNNGAGPLAANFDRVRFGHSGTTPVEAQSFTVE